MTSENYDYKSCIVTLVAGGFFATLSLLSICDIIPITLIFFFLTPCIFTWGLAAMKISNSPETLKVESGYLIYTRNTRCLFKFPITGIRNISWMHQNSLTTICLLYIKLMIVRFLFPTVFYQYSNWRSLKRGYSLNPKTNRTRHLHCKLNRQFTIGYKVADFLAMTSAQPKPYRWQPLKARKSGPSHELTSTSH